MDGARLRLPKGNVPGIEPVHERAQRNQIQSASGLNIQAVVHTLLMRSRTRIVRQERTVDNHFLIDDFILYTPPEQMVMPVPRQ